MQRGREKEDVILREHVRDIKGKFTKQLQRYRARKRKKQEKGYIFLNQSDHNDV